MLNKAKSELYITNFSSHLRYTKFNKNRFFYKGSIYELWIFFLFWVIFLKILLHCILFPHNFYLLYNLSVSSRQINWKRWDSPGFINSKKISKPKYIIERFDTGLRNLNYRTGNWWKTFLAAETVNGSSVSAH